MFNTRLNIVRLATIENCLGEKAIVFQPAALRMSRRSKVDYIGKGIGERPVVPEASETLMGLEVGLEVRSLAAALVLKLMMGCRRHRRLASVGLVSSV